MRRWAVSRNARFGAAVSAGAFLFAAGCGPAPESVHECRRGPSGALAQRERLERSGALAQRERLHRLAAQRAFARDPRLRPRAMRREGVVIERGATMYAAPRPLPPPPRVSVRAPSDAPVATRVELEHPHTPPAGGRTHLRVAVTGGTTRGPRLADGLASPAAISPHPSRGAARAPAEVWLHVDASGSMSGDAMSAASAAAHVLVRRMRPEDRLAIVAHSRRSRVVRGPRPVGDGIDAHRAIDQIVAGAERDGSAAEPPSIPAGARRKGDPLVLFVTDGVGFAASRTRPTERATPDDGRRPTERAAPVIVLVVGDQASAADLAALRAMDGVEAQHLQDPSALPAALGRAVFAHRAAVARDVEVVITPTPGARVTRTYGAGTFRDGGLAVRIPSLVRGEERIVLVELETGRGIPGSQAHLANVSVRYRDALTAEEGRVEARATGVRARDGDDALARRDPSVAASVLAARTGAALATAGSALARGDVSAARRALDEQEELLAIAATSIGEAWVYRDADVIGAYARMVRRAPAVLDEGARRRVGARMVFEGDGRMRR